MQRIRRIFKQLVFFNDIRPDKTFKRTTNSCIHPTVLTIIPTPQYSNIPKIKYQQSE